MLIKISKGLSIPITGVPEQYIETANAVSRVAVIASEYPGLKPKMEIVEGDKVSIGQSLFFDRRYPEVHYVAPASGIVTGINRGLHRVLQSVVIEVDDSDKQCLEQQLYDSYSVTDISNLSSKDVVQHLLVSGLWPAFKMRPYSKTPNPSTYPHSIFVTAIDTRPLAANPVWIIEEAKEAFSAGVQVLCRLRPEKVFVCSAAGVDLPLPNEEKVSHVEFDGPHPAGLAGTHIHFLDPVKENKTVWTIGFQDVIAIGRLFLTGQWPVERVVALAGPTVKRPRLLRTRIGACISELCAHETNEEHNRFIAGSVLEGWQATEAFDFLGRFVLQITVLSESHGKHRKFGWLRPLANAFSLSRAVSWLPPKPDKLVFDCRKNGSVRAFIPLGLYEKVVPLDLLPAPLLKSLLIIDAEMAQKLGCLELDEEDLALCSYICPSKHEFGLALRRTLEKIEKDG